MKKTLFLSAVLTLSSVSVSAATDCLMPQTIINVSEGTATQSATGAAENVTIRTKNAEDSSKSVSELMTQEALTVASKRPAVVKDGQGTLEIREDVGTLNTTLIVREGTLSIKGATVSTLGSKNGNNLVVGGINAKMVLSDGASYTFTDSDRTSSSVNIGGIDGDGTLILTGGSSLSTRQTLFSGTATTLPIPTFENPYWDAGPHYGGTYTKVDGSEKNAYYRVSTAAAGYSNQTTTPRGSLAGTAVIKVTEGSTLSTGTGFYVGNTTLTIDNATVESGTVNNSDNVWIGSSDVFGPTSKAVLTIQNGGQWIAGNGQYAAISYNAGEQSDITITGERSLMQVDGACYLGSNNTTHADIKLTDGGQMRFGSFVYARGSADSHHTLLVDGEGSVLSTPDFTLAGATEVQVRNGGKIDGGELSALRSDVSLDVTSGGQIQLSGPLSLSDGATLSVSGVGSAVSAATAEMKSGAEVTVSGGATIRSTATGVYDAWKMTGSRLTLQDSTMEVGSNLFVNDGSHIAMEGHSSLGSADAWVSVSAASVAVSQDSHVAAYNFNIGGEESLLQNDGTMSLGYLSCSGNGTVRNTGTITMTDTTASSFGGAGSVLTNEGTMNISQLKLTRNGTLLNYGTISATDGQSATLQITNDTRLQTGEVEISGCEGLAAEGHRAQADYTTGLGEGVTVNFATQYGSTVKTLTIGALLTGKDEMQYLSSSDMQLINNTVLSGLGLAKTEEDTYISDASGNYLASNAQYAVAYKHEIGNNITVNYTTDDLNTVTGTESLAVKGGAVLVEQGEGDHHIGTIGSYAETTTETAAAIAVHEQTAGSSVTWEGSELHTVAGERTLIAADNQVKVTPTAAGESGKLAVVSNSELQVQGCITAGNITVESGATMTNDGLLYAGVTVEGTLKGSGTIAGDLQVSRDGTLIVGNSPGYQIVSSAHLEDGSDTVFCVAGMTASSEGNTGWASGTASQLCITEGSLTLDADACITIEFGGDTLIIDGCNGEMLNFAVTLVQGGCEDLTAGQLTALLDHTTFTLTSDAEGLTGLSQASLMGLTITDAAYEVVGADLVLRGNMMLTPEPTTATLSLLALAGLAARRRRRGI